MLPVLYSYRRCPYAMRARMALRYAGIGVEIREISLRDKPTQMLQVSPKGTVPVLVLSDGQVLEQSLQIMDWALAQSDLDDWRYIHDPQAQAHMAELIARNDQQFKAALDRYKYPERYPEKTPQDYRAEGEQFIQSWDALLQQQAYLSGAHIGQADIAIFPFVRQFARVDEQWFNASRYRKLNTWLAEMCASTLFQSVMQKHPVWQTTA